MGDLMLKLYEDNQKLVSQISELQEALDKVLAEKVDKSTLYAKKAQVMKTLSRVPETGIHKQGWRYSTAEDVKEGAREALANAGLALAFQLVDYEVAHEDKRVIVSGAVEFTLQCSETGATETVTIRSEAVDYSKGGGVVADKTFFKLYTTCEKYYLKTTFLISSGDELDSDADSPSDAPPQNQFSPNMLLENLNKVEKIRGFYKTPEDIKDIVERVFPENDDSDGWRQYFVDARDAALEIVNSSSDEDNQSEMPF